MQNRTDAKVLAFLAGACLIPACRTDAAHSSGRSEVEASLPTFTSAAGGPSDGGAGEAAPADEPSSQDGAVVARTNDSALPWQVLHVTGQPVIVRAERSASAPSLGTVRAGGFLLGSVLGPGPDCSGGWYAVKPHGFVCRTEAISTDPSAPAVRVLTEYGLASAAALPFQCGIVAEETPVYLRLPTLEEQKRSESDFVQRRASLLNRPRTLAGETERSDAGQASDQASGARQMPKTLQAGTFSTLAPTPMVAASSITGVLGAGTRVAWIAEFEAENRGWLLTPELLLIPSDRVKPAVISGFHGVEPTDDVGVAFVGTRGIHKYTRTSDGKQFAPSADSWPGEAAVFLASPARAQSEEKYLETVDKGIFVRADQAIVVHASPPGMWGIEPNASWIEVDAKRSFLLLRRGQTITYATLVSVGTKMATRGRFRILAKHLTLASPFDHQRTRTLAAEVPEVILASTGAGMDEPVVSLYAAWWQYTWGTPNNSAGIALAPFDARKVFDWVDPQLPDGWHSVSGVGTWVVVHD